MQTFAGMIQQSPNQNRQSNLWMGSLFTAKMGS
jgi:hypothetical protein